MFGGIVHLIRTKPMVERGTFPVWAGQPAGSRAT